MKLSMAIPSFEDLIRDAALHEVLRRSATWSYDAVEPMICQPEDIPVSTITQALKAFGLSVSGFRTGLLIVRDGLSLSHPDAEVRTQTVNRLVQVAHLCHDFGGVPMLNGMVQGPRRPGVPYQQVRAWIIEGLREVCAVAAELGVLVCVEPLNRNELSYHNTVAEVLALLTELGTHNAALLADTYHMWIEEEDIIDGLRMAMPALGAVHFADSERLAPGLGEIDFEPVVNVLSQMEYEGYITVELPGREDDLTIATAARYLRQFSLGQR